MLNRESASLSRAAATTQAAERAPRTSLGPARASTAAAAHTILERCAISCRVRHPSWDAAGPWSASTATALVKDAKLYPGGARAWDWRETGTRHRPGIQPADVAELVEHGAMTVILSTGVFRMRGVCPETLQLLKDQGVLGRGAADAGSS